jgi:hypothetical protein
MKMLLPNSESINIFFDKEEGYGWEGWPFLKLFYLNNLEKFIIVNKIDVEIPYFMKNRNYEFTTAQIQPELSSPVGAFVVVDQGEGRDWYSLQDKEINTVLYEDKDIRFHRHIETLGKIFAVYETLSEAFKENPEFKPC